MLALIVSSLEVIAAAMLCLLTYRMVSLYLAEKSAQASVVKDIPSDTDSITVSSIDSSLASYQDRMEGLKLAHVFCGMQMVEIKRQFSDLQNTELAWLREAISLYLIGAVEFIGKQQHCDTATRKELIQKVLRSNLNTNQTNASHYLAQAIERQPQSDNDQMVRAGAQAAKMWLKRKAVPVNLSLRSQLNDWGVFA